MATYSQDLRQCVLVAIARNVDSLRQIARRFVVSLSFVVRIIATPPPHRLDRAQTRQRRPSRRAGPDELERLKELVRQQPDATLEELRQRLGASCSLTTIWRALEELRLPRKKKVFRATEQDRPDVQEKWRDFRAELAGVDPRRPVLVDKNSADTSMSRTHGRPPVGGRVYAGAPGHWEMITLTFGLRLSGMTEVMVFEGAMNTGTFENYVEQVLVPELRPGDVVIWDNPKPHQSEEAIEAVEAAGAPVLPIPP